MFETVDPELFLEHAYIALEYVDWCAEREINPTNPVGAYYIYMAAKLRDFDIDICVEGILNIAEIVGDKDAQIAMNGSKNCWGFEYVCEKMNYEVPEGA